MIGIFIAIAACIYFFMEARKRNVSPVKWALIAFVVFMGPQILLSWILLPLVLVLFSIPVDDSLGLQGLIGITGLVIGFWLLVISRKRLYRHRRTVPAENAVKVESLDIIDNQDGTFSVGDRVFKSRKTAEDFVEFTKSLRG